MHRFWRVFYLISLLGLVGLEFAGCGKGLSGSHCSNANYGEQTLTDTLLQSTELDVNSCAPPVFHSILSSANYEAILKLNDLSYAVVNEFGHTLNQPYPTHREIGVIRERIRNHTEWLNLHGWTGHQSIFGRTGLNNVDPDVTCIINSNQAQRLIVVSFHGSRYGDRSPINHNGRGDWGANYDSTPVVPSSLGLTDFPDHVRIHRGFGNNLASARVGILEELDRRIGDLGPEMPIWVLTTGHSKGAGMASLTAGMVKSHFASNPSRFAHVKVGGIFYSAPRAYHGDQSEDWLHNLVDRRNLFRINVHGDPVTVNPGRSEGYRSVGILLLDSIWAVNLRNRQSYGGTANSWLNTDEWANFHYGSGGRGVGYEFDPAVVMRHSDLAGGFEEGRLHLKTRN